jgi:aerobic carbon-monoxide dehydrogenase medium subunit
MKPAAFEYHAPRTVHEVVGLLADLGDGAKVIAGGQSLVPMLALRLAVFDHLVDVGRVEQIRGIGHSDGTLRIGAGTTQRAVEMSSEVADLVPLLARATPLIGHFQIRNRGTVGGSVAHADPAAEYPAVALALNATFEAHSQRGSRIIPASEFFEGLWSTALAPDEILVAISFPVWDGRCGFAIDEVARRHGDFAVAGAAVALELDDRDRVRRCAIALLGLGATPRRAEETEAMSAGISVDDIDAREIGQRAVADLRAVPSDLHGSSDYRARVGGVVVERAWRRAADEARHA